MADDDRRTLAGVGPAAARAPAASEPAPLTPESDAETATGVRGARQPTDPSERAENRRSSSGIRPGDLLADRYRIIRAIGVGGMGEVWEATHTVIGRAVAVKALVPDPRPDSDRAERMMREARIVARIEHPNVVDITDFGHTADGNPFFVMELLRGRSLHAVLRADGPFDWRRVATLGIQLARALAAAHDVGVIHRDLKPGNVLVLDDTGEGESCKLIDFGIAKAVELSDEERTLTRTGVVFGTPAYMSPEQARGETLDGRSDMFALGMILHEALTGERPFHARTPAEMLYLKLFTPPALPSMRAPGRGIPRSIDAIVRRCLFKHRDGRYPDMRAVADALALALAGEPIAAPPEEAMPVPPAAVELRYRETARKSQIELGMAPPAAAESRPRPVAAAGPSPAPGSGLVRVRIAGVAAGLVVGGGVLLGLWQWQRERATSVAPAPSESVTIGAPAEPAVPSPARVEVPAPARVDAPAPVAPAAKVVAPVDAPIEASAPSPAKRTGSKPRRTKPSAEASAPAPSPEPTPPPSPAPKVPDADGIFR